ncbi:hypothetical protein [Bradyrhizobium guangzhouense]|uniref:hypothetical protein n=1 Tax=Bradyrhizobium guangzhouense TaxID=1325095 RepID=UPI001009D878|nr:hypothetical protein [Bradyrhizobium guangzhouense]
MLSPVQVRSILRSVARTHLAKLDRLAVLETADGITADEGRRSDRVMGWARRLEASQGIAAAIGEAERGLLAANGLSPDEIEEVHWTLELLRQGSMGSFPRQKLIALLAACGASQGEGDLRQAERIFFRGQAAALLSVDRRWTGDYREDDKLVDQLLSDHGVAPGVIASTPVSREHPASSAVGLGTVAHDSPAPSQCQQAPFQMLGRLSRKPPLRSLPKP